MNYNVFFGYKKNEIIFNNVFFDFEENKISVVCGHNGAGKTTLLKIISGILPSSVKAAGGWYIPATGGLIQHFTLQEHLNMVNPDYKNNRLVMLAYESFGAAEFEKKRICKLSTGQIMLASIIVAIASDSKLLLLDEPFGALDPTNADKLSVLLKEVCNSGKTIILTSHDLFLTAETADSILFIKNGKISWNSKTEENCQITVDNLKEKYKLYA